MVITSSYPVNFFLPVCVICTQVIDDIGISSKLFSYGFSEFIRIHDINFPFFPTDTDLSGIIYPERLSFFTLFRCNYNNSVRSSCSINSSGRSILNTVNDSISAGFIEFNGFRIPLIPELSRGTPSTTIRGSLLARIEEPPRIRW